MGELHGSTWLNTVAALYTLVQIVAVLSQYTVLSRDISKDILPAACLITSNCMLPLADDKIDKLHHVNNVAHLVTSTFITKMFATYEPNMMIYNTLFLSRNSQKTLSF